MGNEKKYDVNIIQAKVTRIGKGGEVYRFTLSWGCFPNFKGTLDQMREFVVKEAKLVTDIESTEILEVKMSDTISCLEQLNQLWYDYYATILEDGNDDYASKPDIEEMSWVLGGS